MKNLLMKDSKIGTMAVFAIMLITGTLILGIPFLAIGSERNPSIKRIIPEPPSPGLNVRIWTDKNHYNIGSILHIYVRNSETAYIYILDHDTEGNWRLIFPNRYSKNNRLGPGRHEIPPYQFRVAGPSGMETLQVIACTRKIPVYQYLRNPNNPFGTSNYPIIPYPNKLRSELESRLQAKIQFEFGEGKPKAQLKITPVKWDTDFTTFQVGGMPGNERPKAKFNYWPSNPRINQSVNFNASNSYDQDGYIPSSNYLWDFDNDGNTDKRGVMVSKSFNSPGDHLVKLTVRDNKGARDSITKTIRVEGGFPRLNIRRASFFNSNGEQHGGWTWCDGWSDYLKWNWDSFGAVSTNNAYLNFQLRVSDEIEGGTGFGTSLEVQLLNQWGQVVESGRLRLDNPFRPRTHSGRNYIAGYDAYGSYKIENTNILSNGFTARIKWTGENNYAFAAKDR